MKTKAFLTILFLFFGVKSFSTTITTVTITDSICAGQYLYLQWTLSDTLSYGAFEIQSSDMNGSFSSPVSYGFFNIAYPYTTGIDSVYISNSILPGNCYRFRINRVTLPAITGVSSSCVVIGTPSSTSPSFSAVSYPSFQPLSSDTLCVGDMVYFTIINPNPGTSYTWVTSFGNYIQNPFLVLFNSAGVAMIGLQENNLGCPGPLSPADTFITLGNPNVNILGPANVCIGDTVMFQTIFQNSTFLLWSDSSTHSSITDTLNNQAWFTFDSTGTYQIYVYAANTCFDTIGYRTITVLPYPQQPAVIQSGDTLTSSVTATTYRWYKNSVLQPGFTTQSIVINIPADNGSWQVEISNNPNCKIISQGYLIDVGINELMSEIISIFPNPVRDEFTIYPEYSGRFTISKIEIYDMLGNLMFSQEPKASSQRPIVIDVSALSNGIYFIKLKGDKEEMVGKFMKH